MIPDNALQFREFALSLPYENMENEQVETTISLGENYFSPETE